MSLISAICIEFKDNRKICVATENRKKYELQNPNQLLVSKIRADGCIKQNIGEKRCDFLFECESLKQIFFVELKGGDLNQAISQITDTVMFLKDEYSAFELNARIVGSNDVPGFTNTPGYRKLAQYILKSKGTIKRATNNIYTESL